MNKKSSTRQIESKESDSIVRMWRSFKTEGVSVLDPDFRIIDQIAHNFSPGSFFYYIFDYTSYQLRFVHPNVKLMTGIDVDKFSPEVFLGKVHPDDVAGILKKEEMILKFLMDFLPKEKVTQYKMSYVVRVQKPKGGYYYNLNQAISLNLSPSGSISHVLCVETDISHLGGGPLDTISFIDMKGNDSYYNLQIDDTNLEEIKSSKTSLSKQEMEVLRRISYGQDNKKIAKELFISENTVRTHRRNIMKKEDTNNMIELIAKYVRHGFI